MGIGHTEAIVFWSLRQIITLFRMLRCPIPNGQFRMPKEAFIESAIHEKQP